VFPLDGLDYTARDARKKALRDALSRHQSRPLRHHHRHRVGGRAALVSILGILWLWHDTGDAERIAAHAQSTFWYVLPTLPMFLIMPAMLRGGVSFWASLAACCALTFVLYLVTVWLLGKFGIAL